MRMLDALHEYLLREDVHTATALADRFNAALEDEYSLADPLTYAGKAAVLALQTPMYETELSDDYASRKTDAELDPWGWDAGLAASIAAAGGAPWEKGGSISRRREFWSRYLDHAVEAGHAPSGTP